MSAFATDFYVAADGNDANDGLTAATAKATIAGGYTTMTNGTPEATYGNRLVIGAGTFDLPATTTVLSNGWKVVGEGADKTTLAVTAIVQQFDLASSDAELSDCTVNFVGSSKKTSIVGALAKNPKGMFSGLDIVNYFMDWQGNLLQIDTADASPVFTNCTFRDFRINYFAPFVKVANVAATLRFEHCSFIDGNCNTYCSLGTIFTGTKAAVTIRNCLFLRCKNSQWMAGGKDPVGVINANKNTVVENCSIVDCPFIGSAFNDDNNGWADVTGPIVGNPMVVNTLIVGCKNTKGELQPCRAGTYSYCANDAALLAGEGNVQLTDGNFARQGGDDVHSCIIASGPSVDAGKTLEWMSGAKDLRGADRVIGSAPDIGCYEYFASPAVYVAKDGNDANDGLSRAAAKATIQAGYAVITNMTALENYGARLVVGDGEWTSDEIAETVVLSNGWSLVGENGREQTVFKASVRDFKFFNLASADASVRGITFDFNRSNVVYYNYAVSNPKGTIADCEFRNERCELIGGLAGLIGLEDSFSPVISNCVFRNIQNIYNGASVLCGGIKAKGFLIADCSFIDCVSGNSNWAGGGTLFFYCSVGTVRNCLFLRSIVNGASASSFGSNCSVVSCGAFGADLTVDNCSFVDCRINRNSQAGAVGLSGGNAKLTVRNCLSYGCENDAGQVGFVTNLTTKATLAFSHCASEIDNLEQDDGNVVIDTANFRWKKASKGDYAVRTGSPLNAGTNLEWMVGAKDLMGRDRIIRSQVDIGAFEYDFNEPGMLVIYR